MRKKSSRRSSKTRRKRTPKRVSFTRAKTPARSRSRRKSPPLYAISVRGKRSKSSNAGSFLGAKTKSGKMQSVAAVAGSAGVGYLASLYGINYAKTAMPQYAPFVPAAALALPFVYRPKNANEQKMMLGFIAGASVPLTAYLLQRYAPNLWSSITSTRRPLPAQQQGVYVDIPRGLEVTQKLGQRNNANPLGSGAALLGGPFMQVNPLAGQRNSMNPLGRRGTVLAGSNALN